MKPSREVRNAVLGWYLDISESNIDAAVDVLSLSDGVVFIGTDPSEVWVGGANVRAIARRQMEQVGKLNFNPGEILAFEEGTVGWASAWGNMVFHPEPSRCVRPTS